MRKIVYTIVAWIAFSTSFLPAQSAKEVLDKVSNRLNSTVNFYMQFGYSFENKATKSIQKNTGDVYTAKEKFNLTILDVNQMYDGKKLYSISKDEKEINVSTPELNSPELMTPTRLLSMYKTGFSLTLAETKNIGGNKIQYIKLTPTDAKKSNMKWAVIGINTTKNELYDLTQINKDNAVVRITVKKYLENLAIPSAIFIFNKNNFKNYIITELD